MRGTKRAGVLVLALFSPLLAHALTPAERLEQLKARSASLPGPCPFFDATVLHRVFPNSANEAAFKRREKPYPSCTYTWKAKQSQSMKIGEHVVNVPSEGRLTLTRAPSRAEAKDWERVLLGYRNQPLTPVPELGRYAGWSDKRRQLSWIAKGHVFHVAVEDNDQPDALQKNAMAVAAELMRTH
jgi:hypothetical protein